MTRKFQGLWSRLAYLDLWLSHRTQVNVSRTAQFRCANRTTLIEGGGVTVGDETVVESGCSLTVTRGQIRIGRNVYITTGTSIGCQELVEIGDHVAIGPNVVIIDTNKNSRALATPISLSGSASSAVRIGSGSWVGANAVILPGVTIGTHCVVAAGAVVTRSCGDGQLLRGVPATSQDLQADGSEPGR